ncbi:hypothetical protein CDD82_3972 [Ophiocordyceps australis]|uniref:Zn(2)-C6 fungal-type domain-containing protein n=1 Tax=Ophiocordyceps australis TaxID=1399860 RepID=A0A2C5Z3Q3_9HYPO|nr:hypothetical protein CDD82_3972 [Ophiocordyceps australis]
MSFGQAASRRRHEQALMTTFAVSRPRRVTRAKFTKVRTGCVTCKPHVFLSAVSPNKPHDTDGTIGKRRHVKCDEAKPHCRNCIKWAGFCNGYSTASEGIRKGESTSGEQRLARPTSSGQTDSCSESLEMQQESTPRSSVWSSPSSTTTSSPETSKREMSGATATAKSSAHWLTLDDSWWRNVMPQLVKSSTAIRVANTAVHRLATAKRYSSNAGLHDSAMAWYVQALESTRQAAAEQDTQSVVVCALFLSVFASINGDGAAAEMHLCNGQRIVDDAAGGKPEDLRKRLCHVHLLLATQVRRRRRAQA